MQDTNGIKTPISSDIILHPINYKTPS